ncbi:MAG: GTPase HflX, partial [Ignavibacteria bacterium]|nr:GTPase HflX [Ignavibacteria bacterium]
EYFLPRLTRAWTHLSKQYGGIGTKGPGETQIETDRRIIRNKISSLKKKLQLIDVQRDTQRKNRQEFFKAVLVGYTNVGKSTILNHLTDANVLVEDKLFATLDSTTRLIQTKDGNKFLLSDTVGFIRKLPHSLIASFRSTLKEIVDADLILHVIDISHPKYEEQINIVNETLAEIKADKKMIQLVFNKIDLLKDSSEIDRCIKHYPNAVFISAERGININELEEKIIKTISTFIVTENFEINHNQNKLLSSIRQLSESLQTKYLEDKIQIKLTARQSNLPKIKKLISNYAQ